MDENTAKALFALGFLIGLGLWAGTLWMTWAIFRAWRDDRKRDRELEMFDRWEEQFEDEPA